jgi:hypothetical protein
MLLVAESCSACLKFRVDEETGIGWLEILLIAVGGVCLLGVAGVVICFVRMRGRPMKCRVARRCSTHCRSWNAPHRTRWANGLLWSSNSTAPTH